MCSGHAASVLGALFYAVTPHGFIAACTFWLAILKVEYLKHLYVSELHVCPLNQIMNDNWNPTENVNVTP